jgi:anti-anti-sigma factor
MDAPNPGNGTVTNELVEVISRHDRAVPVCELRGEVDASNVDAVEATVLDYVTTESPGLVLDLTETTYLDSAGVRILFDLARRLRSRRQELHICVPSAGIVRRVLVLTALTELVPVEEDVEDAVRNVRARR